MSFLTKNVRKNIKRITGQIRFGSRRMKLWRCTLSVYTCIFNDKSLGYSMLLLAMSSLGNEDDLSTRKQFDFSHLSYWRFFIWILNPLVNQSTRIVAPTAHLIGNLVHVLFDVSVSVSILPGRLFWNHMRILNQRIKKSREYHSIKLPPEKYASVQR